MKRETGHSNQSNLAPVNQKKSISMAIIRRECAKSALRGPGSLTAQVMEQRRIARAQARRDQH